MRYRQDGSLLLGTFGSWYLVVALVLAPLLLDEEGFLGAYQSKRFVHYLIVSIIATFLPLVFSLLGARITGLLSDNLWFSLAILIAPPWGVYLLFSQGDDPFLSRVRSVWLIVIIVLLIATVLKLFTGLRLPDAGATGLDIRPGKTLLEAWDHLREGAQSFFNTIIGMPARLGVFVDKNLNDSLGRAYTGQVDPYSERSLGVEFTDMRSFSSYIYEGKEFFIWTDIYGENFKDQINMVVRCYAVPSSVNDRTVYNGTVTVQGRSDGRVLIEGRQKLTADCRFDGLPAGEYNVWFEGSFPFDTWAYVQYYFAPEEKVLEAQRNGRDPAYEAGIDEYPVATYTGGPVEVGLGSNLPQPIGLDTMNPLEDLPSFGASVMNAWSDQGEVTSVRHISLLVPQPFLLKGCDRYDGSRHRGRGADDAMTPLEDHSLPGYREYTFGDVGDVNTRFESVTCYLTLDGEDYSGSSTARQQEVARELLGGYDLVLKTFAAKTNYLYTIKENLRVTVYDD
ncbi:hypothetical protein JXA12_03670 [Candidatus Woesearchaeota archaeon]|nr:hypothetical protein [Candidatus Woesearchaeota archaeon]